MIKSITKSLIYGALSSFGLPRISHRLFGRGRAPILMYHGIVRRPLDVADWCFVSEADFDKQMQYLAAHFDVVPLPELPNRLAGPASARPLAAITFDDGYANNHEIAWPILKRYNLPATIFLNTALIGTADTVWFCRVNDALARTSRRELEWKGRSISIATAEEKSAASDLLQDSLKQLKANELKIACDQLVLDLGGDPRRQVAADSPFRMLSPSQVQEMAYDGLVEFGAHTRTHTILAPLPDDEMKHEIIGSIDDVAHLSGKPCRMFAYPNGRAEDYDARAMNMLQDRGMIAVTTIPGPNTSQTSPLELKRYGIGAAMPWSAFLLEIHHVKAALR